jgi:hypothetical protein
MPSASDKADIGLRLQVCDSVQVQPDVGFMKFQFRVLPSRSNNAYKANVPSLTRQKAQPRGGMFNYFPLEIREIRCALADVGPGLLFPGAEDRVGD